MAASEQGLKLNSTAAKQTLSNPVLVSQASANSSIAQNYTTHMMKILSAKEVNNINFEESEPSSEENN